MKFNSLSLLLISSLLLFSCAREEEVSKKSTYVSGTVIVDEVIDASGDNSGIQLISTLQNEAGHTDTLFIAQTDSSGFFEGTAWFSQNDIYPLIISRNQNIFGYVNIIFADGDSVNIKGRIPNIVENIEITSPENDLYRTFERVDRSFSRVAAFINAGGLSADSIQAELEKWSDIYWEIFKDYPDTYASRIAGESAFSILRGWNDSLMIERANIVLDQYNTLLPGTRTTLVNYYSETEGLERAMEFLNKLKTKSTTRSDLISLEMQAIELLFDSSRTKEANQLLQQFRASFTDIEQAMEWAENISYDLEFLSPGAPFPSIVFRTVNGDSINTDELNNKPFLIEITRLDNRLYQQQFDRTVAIYQIYRNFDLEIITIPIETSPVTLEAFFAERSRLWHVAMPNSFDADEIIDILNINRVPTRFLVNRDGHIVRRYIGNEYDDVVRGLQQITTNND